MTPGQAWWTDGLDIVMGAGELILNSYTDIAHHLKTVAHAANLLNFKIENMKSLSFGVLFDMLITKYLSNGSFEWRGREFKQNVDILWCDGD